MSIYDLLYLARTMANWQFMAGRVTLFPGQPVEQKASEMFRYVWSAEPDSFQSGAPSPFGPTSVAIGAATGLVRTVNVQLGRMDIAVSPPDGSNPVAQMQLMNKDAVFSALDYIVDNLPAFSCSRVACFISLAQHAANVEAANATLCEVIEGEYRPNNLTDEEDFLLQINRQVRSQVNSRARYNLLKRYSVDKMHTIAFPVQGQAAVSISEIVLPSIAIDFNSKPEQSLFSPDESSSLVKDLCSFAKTEADRYS